jgi:outer membrane protein assembly factor BamB
VSRRPNRRDVLRSAGAGLLAAGLGSTAVVPGSAQVQNPTEISTPQELQAIADDLSGDYVLVADIDLSGVENFEPLGTESEAFTGTFDGGGYTISGLTIDRAGAQYVGLFGAIGDDPFGVVRNVTLDGVDVSGNAFVGGLAGVNGGNVSSVTVSGSVVGTELVGGVVGGNGGCIWDAESSCSVTGEETVGGLAGANDRFITDSVATGAVQGDVAVGGLVGSVGSSNTRGYISESSASGSVTGTTDFSANLGGLAGGLDGTIESSTASGDVSGFDRVGTLVGTNVGKVVTSSASGTASSGDGSSNSLVGENSGDIVTASDPALGGGDRTEWWFQSGTGDAFDGGPTVVNGTVYVGNRYLNDGGCEPMLYAVDAASGEQEWVLDTDDGGTRVDQTASRVDSYPDKSAPTVVDGTAYVKLRYPGTVLAVDAASGAEQWRADVGAGGSSGSPTVYDGTVYATGNDALYGFDPDTGDRVFFRGQLDVDGTSVTAAHGQVYLYATSEGGLAALDAETGETNWVYEDAEDPREFSATTVAQETVYATADDGTVYAVDAANGAEVWRQSLTFDGQTDRPETTPTVADGTVYVGTEYGRLYAFDATSGDEQWRYETHPDGRFGIESAPTVVDDTVFFGSDADRWEGTIHAVDTASGDLQWSVTTRGPVRSAPTVADGTLYAGTYDGHLYAIDAGVSGSSGDSRVTLRTLGHVTGSSPPTNELATDDPDDGPESTPTPDDSTPTPTDSTPTPSDPADSTPTPTETPSPTPDAADDTTAGGSGPGPGILGTVGSLVGAGYLIERYTDADDEE